MAQEGSVYGTGRHPHCKGGLSLWHKRALYMAPEDIPHCKGGLSLWHKRAVKMAPEDIPIAKEGCPYGTGGQCIRHRTVAMAQEDNPMAKKGWMFP